MRYRIAVLDPPDGRRCRTGARRGAAGCDSKYAALYYPWVRGPRPGHRSARSTCRRAASWPASTPATTSSAACYKAPANEVVPARASASRCCSTTAQQEVLNPRGRQLLPLLRGPRLPALGRAHDQLRPGVEVRQPAPLLRLPRALDRPRHAVGGVRAQRRALWANVRRTIEDFLFNEFSHGALLGDQAGGGVLRRAATARR